MAIQINRYLSGQYLLPLLGVVLAGSGAAAHAQWGGPGAHVEVAETRKIEMGGGVVQVDFAAGKLDLGADAIAQHIKAAAAAVTAYYGRFPVNRVRVLVIPVAGRSGVLQGTTWGDMRGFPSFTRLRIGEHTTAADLADDWTTTHELVHSAFPSQPDDQNWIEEGIAVYVEPLARVMTGELAARRVWRDMVRDMPKGEPEPGDEGIDHTHTWARTYWGGALFCLVADVEIRKETGNKKGLRDALRAIVDAGGTIDHDWPLTRAFEVGDRATGTHVLSTMYAQWKDKPVTVDLEKLWIELGVRQAGDGVEFDAKAPLARVRDAIAGAGAAAQPSSGRAQ